MTKLNIMPSAFLKPESPADSIYKIISALTPFDTLEGEQIEDTLRWIASDEPIFRIKSPDIPKKHLVSYFVVFDQIASKILLVDHKKAELWLPSGGHVEEGEDPGQTVIRECYEELNLHAKFWNDTPLFLTSTLTVGLEKRHIDVSLWYILCGNSKDNYKFDEREFNSIKWFAFDEIPYERSDPHMKRFVQKLKGRL